MQENRNAGDEKVTRLLGALAPAAADRPEPRRALRQFKSRIELTRRDGFTMFGIQMSKKVQRTLAASIGVAALVGLLAIPQVQALASGFLSIFRVERFVLVNISQDRMDQIQKVMGNDASEFGAHETIKDGGDPQTAASIDEAASLAGFTPLQADVSYGDAVKVEVSNESVVRYRPDVKSIREVYTAMNLDPELIPANIDGKAFDITMPGGIMATYGKGKNAYGFLQVPSPTLKAPDDVDAEKLGEAMLQLLGMSPDEAARLSKSIDWTSTLVVPVPQGLESVREVTVRGGTGLLYVGSGRSAAKDYTGNDPDASPNVSGKDKAKSAPSYNVTLVWQADGYLYSVMGPGTTQVTAFAESLH